jgi:hypothetical protein
MTIVKIVDAHRGLKLVTDKILTVAICTLWQATSDFNHGEASMHNMDQPELEKKKLRSLQSLTTFELLLYMVEIPNMSSLKN